MRHLVAALSWVLTLGCTCPSPAQRATPEQVLKRVREPAAAGRFYPSDALKLSEAVTGYLAQAPSVATAPVRMVLTPHAGLEFSGQIAADAFKQLTPGFERAVIIAGNHNGDASYAGLSVDRATHYRVPGLEVKVSPSAAKLLERPGFVDVPAAHTMHMVEIELPFLKAVNRASFEIVPLVAGRLSPTEARAAASELLKLADAKTIFVFSVDLSHYYSWDQAVALDRPCLAALARSDAQAVSACDTDATQVLYLMNELSARLDLTPRLVAYANSGDVTGSKAQVVGYGALVYEDRFVLGADEGGELVKLARLALETRVREGKTLAVPPELVARWPRLAGPRGAFVTLKKAGELRGCIGTLAPEVPLAQDVVDNAINAAINDPRFSPVKPDELASIALSISVLTSPRPLEALGPDALVQQLTQSHPGLIIEYQGRRSTFLPEVWDELPETTGFLGQLCRKQGAPQECWRDPSTRFQTYQSQHFAEVR